MNPPEACKVHESVGSSLRHHFVHSHTILRNPLPIRSISDPLKRTIIQHGVFSTFLESTGLIDAWTLALNTKERVYYEDITSEPRFASEAQQSPHRSVICIPIFSNRGQTFGAVYLASKYAFSPNIVTMLTLLCQQASIGISNALLFRSVQAGTKENLKMISAQRDALEAARKSREDALKATKVLSLQRNSGTRCLTTVNNRSRAIS